MQENISIILVQPQLGENIGAAARAMKNFGLSDLRIVDPRDGWPNEKADAMSVGAIDLIQSAQIYSTTEDAIKDLNFVYAATAQKRDMNKNYVLSRDISTDILNKGKVGILFGRESTGLNNQEIALSNKILTIDTQENFSSLNIAHAVCVVGYELFQSLDIHRQELENTQELASKEELEYLHTHLIESLEATGFFKADKKQEQMSMKIRNIFSRIENLSSTEVQILRGIIACLNDKL